MNDNLLYANGQTPCGGYPVPLRQNKSDEKFALDASVINNTLKRRAKSLKFVSFVLIFISICVYGFLILRFFSGVGSDSVSDAVFGAVFGVRCKSGSAGFDTVTAPKSALSLFFGRFSSGADESGGTADDASESAPEQDAAGSIPSGAFPIESRDMSSTAPLGLSLSNETSYDPDLFVMYNAYKAASGTVLIIHTHGTESFSSDGAEYYYTSDSFRSQDITENVVAVGEALAAALRDRGIEVIHDTTMYDAESYNNAYKNAAAAIKRHLAEHPEITYVFDVHRDSIVTAGKTKIRPVTEICGEDFAQFMIVAGTDENGADFDSWTDNLTFAAALQSTLAAGYPSLTRPINLRKSAFNEQYTSGSLLFEIGSCGNSLDEAKRTAALVGNAVADIINASAAQ